MIGASLDIFGYRNEIYFYMFFNEPESMRDCLAVFVHQGGVTRPIVARAELAHVDLLAEVLNLR